jgi:hypothetical protein
VARRLDCGTRVLSTLSGSTMTTSEYILARSWSAKLTTLSLSYCLNATRPIRLTSGMLDLCPVSAGVSGGRVRDAASTVDSYAHLISARILVDSKVP